jgi:hypothetical protein
MIRRRPEGLHGRALKNFGTRRSGCQSFLLETIEARA